MRQVFDRSGNPIKGLFRRADDSLVVIDDAEFNKNKLSHDAFESLNKEVQQLKAQMALILEKINDR